MIAPFRRGAIAMLLAALPTLGAAQVAMTSGNVNLRAGPGLPFPLVATLAAGTPVQVEGCVADYSWCDVWFGQARGWISAAYLQAIYENSYVPVVQYGPLIGMPVLGFSVGPYWDNHYRGRSWYHQRDSWIHRPAPVFQPYHPPAWHPRPHPGIAPGYGPGHGPAHGPGWTPHPMPSVRPHPGYQPGFDHRPGFDPHRHGYEQHRPRYDSHRPNFDQHRPNFDQHRPGFDQHRPHVDSRPGRSSGPGTNPGLHPGGRPGGGDRHDASPGGPPMIRQGGGPR